MKKKTKRWIGAISLALGAAGATGIMLLFGRKRSDVKTTKGNVWARPGMKVTFRAELMPGRSEEERSFLVKELLSTNRVTLVGISGEHAENEFKPLDK
jgi:uncharacterized protein YqfB (UPF0267 family)